MKFEKLNENKIRIILSNQDLADKNIDFNSIIIPSLFIPANNSSSHCIHLKTVPASSSF